MRFAFAAVVIVSALVGAGVAVGIMAWEPWDEREITATEAEVYAIDHVDELGDDPSSSVAAWGEEGYWPFCHATDRAEGGWLVQCGMKHLTKDIETPILATYIVRDDGTVHEFPQ
jgi:hypothetical protein